MKRSILTLTLSLFTASLLAACGGPAMGPAPPAGSPAPVASPAPAASAAPAASPAKPMLKLPADKLTQLIKPNTGTESEPEAEISNLSGIWVSGSGGRYYLRQSGELIIWYGESSAANPDWAQAAIGRRNVGGNLDMIWVDLPKGDSANTGIMKAQVGPGAKFDSLSNSGPMGDTAWTRESASNLPVIDNVAVAVATSTPPAFNLSGVWECDDGGRYYISHQNGRLIWYGENAPLNTAWANLAYGSMEGEFVSLHWADLPKGHADGSGKLVLKALDADHLQLSDSTGSGFGGSQWTRIN